MPAPHDHRLVTHLDYELSLAQPLTTDLLVEARVAHLIGRARRRQLWFLFLDEQGVQLPLIVPVTDPPRRPYAALAGLGVLVGRSARGCRAASVVVVLERPAPPTLMKDDRAWARAVHAACDAEDVAVRATLISHLGGVRALALEDYRL